MLKCQVDANPAIVTFHWTFNNSGDLTEVPASRFTSELTTSRLNYTPVSDMEYGTLSCWGDNEVGYQRTPCVFQIVAAGNFSELLQLNLCRAVRSEKKKMQLGEIDMNYTRGSTGNCSFRMTCNKFNNYIYKDGIDLYNQIHVIISETGRTIQYSFSSFCGVTSATQMN